MRTPAELARVSGLILVGGESSAISLLIQKSALLAPLRAFVSSARRGNEGKAVWGTCAGMILLAKEVVGGRAGDKGAEGFAGLNGVAVRVVRNQFGRQAESFQHALELPFLSAPYPAIFIRAPMAHSLLAVAPTDAPLDVLARLPASRVPTKSQHPQADIGPDADVVMMRQGNVVVSSFHPELTADARVHEWWVDHVVRV